MMTRFSFLLISMAAMTLNTRALAYDVANKSIGEIEADLAAGKVTSVELVREYESRIARYDPLLRSVIAVNPDAMVQAKRADLARKSGAHPGPLAGVPILIKDNIETADPMATTAGSLALKDNVTGRDAPLVARLRAAGAVILGKTNLSEWANIRSSHSISGWSADGRPGAEPLRSPPLAVRVQRRLRRRCRRGLRRRRDRDGDRRLDLLPLVGQRPGGHEADGRPRLADPRRADQPYPGHARPDDAHGRATPR